MKYFISLLFFIAALEATSQSISTHLRKARKAADLGDYAAAAKEYQIILAKDSNHINANLEYGLLEIEYLNDPARAGKFLIRAEKNSKKDTIPEIFLGMARYYQLSGKYELAIQQFNRLLKEIDIETDEGKLFESEVRRNVESCRYAIKFPKTAHSFRLRIRNLGEKINTIYPEYVPVVNRQDNILMFTSRRRISNASKIDDEEGGFYEDMYVTKRDPNGIYGDPSPFSLQDTKIPGNVRKHEAVVSLSYHDDKFFTYYNNFLYQSDLLNNTWSKPVLIDDSINIFPKAYQNHLCLTMDGNTMYFTSDRPGGFGGLDIYKSNKMENGKWGPAINLGNTINTPSDEASPQLSPDGNWIYFASKGHQGYGGYDLFKSRIAQGNPETPANIGTPFNSPGDDIYLSIIENEKHGYLSSSREGGFGDMDLYEIYYLQPFSEKINDPNASVDILSADTFFAGQPADFHLKINSPYAGQIAKIHWMMKDSSWIGKEAISTTFLQPGSYKIQVETEDSTGKYFDYEKSIIVSAKPATETLVANNNQKNDDFKNNLPNKNNTSPSLANIYFDFNASGLDHAAEKILESNIDHLKLASQKVLIEVYAYADARGSDKYNMSLSFRRAKSVVKFLESHGIKSSMIKKIIPKGEADPVNHCVKSTPCSEDEYKLNRRVEIKLAK